MARFRTLGGRAPFLNPLACYPKKVDTRGGSTPDGINFDTDLAAVQSTAAMRV